MWELKSAGIRIFKFRNPLEMQAGDGNALISRDEGNVQHHCGKKPRRDAKHMTMPKIRGKKGNGPKLAGSNPWSSSAPRLCNMLYCARQEKQTWDQYLCQGTFTESYLHRLVVSFAATFMHTATANARQAAIASAPCVLCPEEAFAAGLVQCCRYGQPQHRQARATKALMMANLRKGSARKRKVEAGHLETERR